MAMRVVHRLEVIDIEDHQRERPALMRRLIEQRRQM
jgi:hypothetical protein